MEQVNKNQENNTTSGYQHIASLIIYVILIILVSYIASIKFFRIDLTSEKRYTLSKTTKEGLSNLKDAVFIKVYISGDLPVGFKKLQKSTKELLDEFRVYAPKNIDYEFINPYDYTDESTRKAVFKELFDKGLQPTNIHYNDDEGGQTQKLIFPGAIINYKDISIGVNLLENNPGMAAEENLNNSIQSLEYNLINTILSITSDTIRKIAFIEGHGELDQYEVGDITKELANYYQIDRGQINGVVKSLDRYEVVIIAKPTQEFSEEDKFVLDQYIMHGGKVVWLIDAVNISLDSINKGPSIAFIQQLNLEDQLFRYGIRINPVLIQDIQCALIPINTAITGNSPKFTPTPWYYFPLLSPRQDHAITKNLNLVKAEFTSYIDTLGNNNEIMQTTLLSTSKYTKLRKAPTLVSFEEIKSQLIRNDFNKSFLPVAILLEGKFTSVFNNRPTNQLELKGNFTFKDKSDITKMAVIADGDIIKNYVKYTIQGPIISPLGHDRLSNQSFGNKKFILNLIQYLNDETSLLSLRTRSYQLRLLNKMKITNEKIKWQLLNTLLPIILVILSGIAYTIIRKKKYSI